jgi:hypothetical protein
LYSLETGQNKGDSGDFWRPGMELGPGPVDSVASVTVFPNKGDYPNTNSYLSGIIKSTGIHLFNITVEGDIMSFQIEGMQDNELQYTLHPTTSMTTSSPSHLSSEPSLEPTHLHSSNPSGMPRQVFSNVPSILPVSFPKNLFFEGVIFLS